MIFITAKHDCMQFVLNKSSPILFKLDILLFFYPVNANVLPFVASLHPKSYFIFHHLRGVINVGWPHGLLWK